MQREVSVPRDGLEIGIGVQEGQTMADGDGRDQAVHQAADGLPAAATAAVDVRRGVEIGRGAVEHPRPAQQRTQVVEVSLVPGAREDLHANRIGDRDIDVQQTVDLLADVRATVTQEFDPRRGVDENQCSGAGRGSQLIQVTLPAGASESSRLGRADLHGQLT